jgi:hypothetical protein
MAEREPGIGEVVAEWRVIERFAGLGNAERGSTTGAAEVRGKWFGSPRGTSLRNGFGETSFEATPAGTNRVCVVAKQATCGFQFSKTGQRLSACWNSTARRTKNEE